MKDLKKRMVKVKLLRYTEDGIKLIAESCRVSGIPENIKDEEIVRMIVEMITLVL